jgi:hypothetical protein
MTSIRRRFLADPQGEFYARQQTGAPTMTDVYPVRTSTEHYSTIGADLSDLEQFLQAKVAAHPGVDAWAIALDKVYQLHDDCYAAALGWDDYQAATGGGQGGVTTASGGRSKPKKKRP